MFVADKDYKFIGDMALVVKKRSGLSQEDMQNIAAEIMKKSSKQDLLIIFVENLSDIRLLSADIMRQHGWVKQHDLITDAESRLLTHLFQNAIEGCDGDGGCERTIVSVAAKLGVKHESVNSSFAP